MKKLSAILLILLMMVSLSSCMGDWSLNYSDTVTTDGWDIALDRDGKMAFAAAYVWDGSEEGRRIRIPDIVEGCTVFKLGGYFGRGLPMPFSVVMPAGPRESVIPAGEDRYCFFRGPVFLRNTEGGRLPVRDGHIIP